MDQTFIAAVLTAIGYSINDKVVVFDRIREELGKYPNRSYFDVFNLSINATLTRTIMTSSPPSWCSSASSSSVATASAPSRLP